MSRVPSPPVEQIDNSQLNDCEENAIAYGIQQTVHREQDPCEEDFDEDEYEVELQDDGSFKTTFYIPRRFYGRLMGRKSVKRKQIESETNTQIQFPSKGDSSNSLVVIKGTSRGDVCRGRKKIDLMFDSLQDSVKARHIVSIRLPDSLTTIFDQFKKSILSEGHPDIDDKLFTKLGKLHITLALCTLLSDEELIKAKEVFTEFKEYVAKQPPIEIKVHGLGITNKDPRYTKILYARGCSPGLQAIAKEIFGKFKEAGLNTKKTKNANNLCFTLMKSVTDTEKFSGEKKPFDCRSILKKYAHYEFGTFYVNGIDLSLVCSEDVRNYTSDMFIM